MSDATIGYCGFPLLGCRECGSTDLVAWYKVEQRQGMEVFVTTKAPFGSSTTVAAPTSIKARPRPTASASRSS